MIQKLRLENAEDANSAVKCFQSNKFAIQTDKTQLIVIRPMSNKIDKEKNSITLEIEKFRIGFL